MVAQRHLDRHVARTCEPEPVGEPAATAAWNLGTPVGAAPESDCRPVFHCRQRYIRSLRRIHASRLVSTIGVWQKPK